MVDGFGAFIKNKSPEEGTKNVCAVLADRGKHFSIKNKSPEEGTKKFWRDGNGKRDESFY